jgi:signal transduction histidine kinase/ActR/RegA family two-component response regulator
MARATDTIVSMPAASMPAGRRAVRSLLTLGVIVVTIVVLGGVALLAFAAASVDRLQAQEERSIVQTTIARAIDRLASDVASAAVWGQAYVKLRPGMDAKWADTEIGSYLTNNRGHDWIVAIDAQDHPFYAWADGHRLAPGELDPLMRDAAPLLRQVRLQEAAPGADISQAKTAKGLIRSGGQIYLVAVSTVTSKLARTAPIPGPLSLMVSGQPIDARLLSTMSEELRIRLPRVQAARSRKPGAIALNDIDGRPLAWLSWEAKQPGLEAVRRAAPLVLPGVLLLALAGLALTLRMKSVLRDLDLYEAGQKAALAEVVEARDRAQSANLAKSQFLANMSHEIRTPLNGVLGMAQVMEQSGLGEPHREHLKIIRNSGETLLAILNDVLDLSKIEAGRFELDDHVFDLGDIVTTACRPFSLLARQKDVTFTKIIADDAQGAWRGDSVRLRQVLSNLASNAVKFTHEGDIRLTITADGDGLSFSISDTGIGIAPENIPGLFEKFVQADSSTTRRFGGTGLGLAISRELVERMGGTLRMDSVPGQGSTFTFHLPFPRAEAVKPVEVQAGEDDIRALRILAAEDNATNQLILRALLEPTGVDLHTVANGREAVDAFHAARFDLILMDVQMPVMNGVEAARAIRERESEHRLTPTPILALSANVMSHQVEEYALAGMDGVVAKPVDVGKLIEAITAAMDRAAG